MPANPLFNLGEMHPACPSSDSSLKRYYSYTRPRWNYGQPHKKSLLNSLLIFQLLTQITGLEKPQCSCFY